MTFVFPTPCYEPITEEKYDITSEWVQEMVASDFQEYRVTKWDCEWDPENRTVSYVLHYEKREDNGGILGRR